MKRAQSRRRPSSSSSSEDEQFQSLFTSSPTSLSRNSSSEFSLNEYSTISKKRNKKKEENGKKGNCGSNKQKQKKTRRRTSLDEEPLWLTQLKKSHRRRSRRSNTSSSLQDLAQIILSNRPVLFITGAGLSAASGIRPFRGANGIWSEVIWKMSTREEFRKDPLEWYNSFWLKYFPPYAYGEFFEPNEGHEAISMLSNVPGANIKVITQNVDGLHSMTKTTWNHERKLIEAHGRLGLYKCIPESDSDTDSDSDDENDRKVKIGSRRKSRIAKAAYKRGRRIRIQQQQINLQPIQNSNATSNETNKGEPGEAEKFPCKYQVLESIPVQMVWPPQVGRVLAGIDSSEIPCNTEDKPSDLDNEIVPSSCQFNSWGRSYNVDKDAGKTERRRNDKKNGTNIADSQPAICIKYPPLCPSCNKPVAPQALLFDEGYHSHEHYQFERMEQWIEQAEVIVFVGTSFAVSLTDCALEHARQEQKLVYNFNIESGKLESTAWLNVENVVGDVQRTLPMLVKACEEEFLAQGNG